MIYGRVIFKVVHALFLFEASVMRFFFVFHGISSPDIPVVFCTESYERL